MRARCWCQAEDEEVRGVAVVVQAAGGVVDASPGVPALDAGGAVNSGAKSDRRQYYVQAVAITTAKCIEQRASWEEEKPKECAEESVWDCRPRPRT